MGCEGADMELADLSHREFSYLVEHQMREQQLRNIHTVMSKGMPPHKLKRFERVILPQYIRREYNARAAAEKLMKKRGLVYRGRAV